MLDQSFTRRLTCLSLEGELDAATIPEACEPLFKLLERGECAELHVDCSGIWFIDARGLSMMARAQRIAEESGCRLVWMDPPEHLLKLLTIRGMYEYVSIGVSV
jgi:anti-anti-sigma factor